MPAEKASKNTVSFRRTPQNQKPQGQGNKAKGSSNKPASAPEQVFVSRHEVGVKECLVWRSNSAKKVPTNDETQTRLPEIFIPKKPELGRAKLRGYDLPDEHAAVAFKDTNGTVIEALRGWPNNQPPPRKSILDQYLAEQAIVEEQQRKLDAIRATNKAKSKKNNKNKKKGAKKEEEPLVVELDERSEPVMPELISHRFLYENLIREAEERRARQVLEQGDDESANGSGPIEVKSNRAAQLRAIHLGTKVTVSPKDMWQMSQFKDTAHTQLDTFRRAQRNA